MQYLERMKVTHRNQNRPVAHGLRNLHNGATIMQDLTDRRGGSRSSGFTMIELLVAIAVIAVLAALAIPNLLQSKIASNETATISSMRTYVAAQSMYIKTDFDQDGRLTYAEQFRDLYYTLRSGVPLGLIDREFADAGSADKPRSGYFFEDLNSFEGGSSFDYTVEFGLSALPAGYRKSGINTFVVDASGCVFQKDRSSNDSLGGVYPDVFAADSGWIPAPPE